VTNRMRIFTGLGALYPVAKRLAKQPLFAHFYRIPKG